MRAITVCLACLAAVATVTVIVRRQPASAEFVQAGATATAVNAPAHIETKPDVARLPAARGAVPVATAVAVATPPHADEPLPSSSIVARFDTLAAQAERGDMDAARQLYDSLAHCLRASRSASAGAVPGTGARRWRAAWFETQCASYRQSHYARLLDITAAGAKAGDDYLRGEYYALDPLTNGAFEPQQFEKYRENAREFLADMVARDNPDGYLLMSDAYAAGRIVGHDDIAAYAYYLAWRDASPAQSQGSTAPPSFTTRLSAEQLRQGEALSRSIRGKAPHS